MLPLRQHFSAPDEVCLIGFEIYSIEHTKSYIIIFIYMYYNIMRMGKSSWIKGPSLLGIKSLRAIFATTSFRTGWNMFDWILRWFDNLIQTRSQTLHEREHSISSSFERVIKLYTDACILSHSIRTPPRTQHECTHIVHTISSRFMHFVSLVIYFVLRTWLYAFIINVFIVIIIDMIILPCLIYFWNYAFAFIYIYVYRCANLCVD